MSNEYKTGRKGVYREWITDEGLTIVKGWAMDGLSNKQIAHNMGIDESTFYEWQNKFSQFSEAVKEGKEVIDRQVENALLKRALGYEVEESKTYMKDDGTGRKTKHVEKTNKHVASDATSMIFWLKNRKPNEWNDRKHVEHSGGLNNTNVNTFKDISTEELKRLANLDTGHDVD